MNQQQVDINGRRVGTNRPDLQYTLGRERFYEEFETRSMSSASAHQARILANDPMAISAGWLIP